MREGTDVRRDDPGGDRRLRSGRPAPWHPGRLEHHPTHTVAFAAAAAERCHTVLLEQGDHMEHIDPGSASWRAVVEWL